MWNVHDGSLLYDICFHSKPVMLIEVVGVRNDLCISCDADGQLAMWDLHSGVLQDQLSCHAGAMSCVASPSGKQLWTAGFDKRLLTILVRERSRALGSYITLSKSKNKRHKFTRKEWKRAKEAGAEILRENKKLLGSNRIRNAPTSPDASSVPPGVADGSITVVMKDEDEGGKGEQKDIAKPPHQRAQTSELVLEDQLMKAEGGKAILKDRVLLRNRSKMLDAIRASNTGGGGGGGIGPSASVGGGEGDSHTYDNRLTFSQMAMTRTRSGARVRGLTLEHLLKERGQRKTTEEFFFASSCMEGERHTIPQSNTCAAGGTTYRAGAEGAHVHAPSLRRVYTSTNSSDLNALGRQLYATSSLGNSRDNIISGSRRMGHMRNRSDGRKMSRENPRELGLSHSSMARTSPQRQDSTSPSPSSRPPLSPRAPLSPIYRPLTAPSARNSKPLDHSESDVSLPCATIIESDAAIGVAESGTPNRTDDVYHSPASSSRQPDRIVSIEESLASVARSGREQMEGTSSLDEDASQTVTTTPMEGSKSKTKDLSRLRKGKEDPSHRLSRPKSCVGMPVAPLQSLSELTTDGVEVDTATGKEKIGKLMRGLKPSPRKSKKNSSLGKMDRGRKSPDGTKSTEPLFANEDDGEVYGAPVLERGIQSKGKTKSSKRIKKHRTQEGVEITRECIR